MCVVFICVTAVQLIFNMTSSRWDPIRGITLQGLQFTASQYTYMVRHTVCCVVCGVAHSGRMRMV